ncbi:BatD family protein [Chitinophaga sp. RAB17]|uniref:BatD family protein n=1 Tax=Chitinophaga sp. RAB17 TaxID=3233049 RepID=UPI003F92E7CE
MIRQFITLMYILFCAAALQAQVKCFAKVELDRSDVYIQQPFKVTYTVLTSTWYTQPLEFDNIQIPAAFVIPFTKAQPGRFTDNGTEYSGIQFYFIVFPYKAGVFSVPSITINAATPPEGSAVSSKITLHTTPVSFVVKPVPRSLPAGEDWLVARDILLSSRWNKPLTNLKVGDVIERTLTIDASGTLPQFIPPMADRKVSWAEVYPGKVSLQDMRDEYNANGERVQTSSWLLTQAGEFELPSESISWWNPYAARMYTRSIPAVKLSIAPNPGLGMLTTLKDSLAKTAAPTQSAKKGPFLIAGMIWYKALALGVAGLLLLGFLLKAVLYLSLKIKNARKHYLQSEAYWFRRLMRTTTANGNVSTQIYQWWDRWPAIPKNPAIGATLQEQQEDAVATEWAGYEAAVYGQGGMDKSEVEKLKHSFRQYRRRNKRRHSAGHPVSLQGKNKSSAKN